MTTTPTPRDHHTVTPYLIVEGVAKLIDFLKEAFRAEEVFSPMLRPDGSIMHAEVRIGDSMVMMGEPTGEFKPMPAGLHLYMDDTDAVYARALGAGAIPVMEPADQFHGDRMAGVKDPAGNLWWIATHKEDVPREELERRAGTLVAQQS